MKSFLAIVALLGSASATSYSVVPADGIFVYVQNYDDSVARMEKRINEKERLESTFNPFDGLYHTDKGLFDA